MLTDLPFGITTAILTLLLSTAGAVLQGSVGFGYGLLAAPVLLLLYPGFVPGPVVGAALILTIMVSYRERGSVKVDEVRWVIFGRVSGTVMAALALAMLPVDTLTIMFGIVVLAGVGLSLIGWHLRHTRGNLFGIGILSGFMATTTAIGGPPLALIYQNYPGKQLRGTLSVIFLIGTILSLVSLFIIGHFGAEELRLTLFLCPGTLIGFWLSNHVIHKLDSRWVRPAVLLLSGLSAAGVILKSVL